MSDGRLVRVKLKFERDFTQIPNEWMRDPNLSLRARGLLGLLMSHKEGYIVTFHSLAAQNQEGLSAIRGAVQQLREQGYLTIEKQRRRDGAITGSVWTLTDPAEQKARSQPKLDFPYIADPNIGHPNMDDRTLKEAQLEEDLSKELKTAGSTRVGIKEDALSGDSLPVATESPAERYQRLIAAKCPGRTHAKPHYWLASGYCEHCGARQPALDLETTGVDA